MAQPEFSLPSCPDVEAAVLGSVLIDPTTLDLVSEWLRPEHFYVLQHQIIYRAMLEMHTRGEAIDLLTLTQYLLARGQLETIGGETRLAELTASVPTALNAEAYARAVVATATRRRILKAVSDMARLAYNQTLDIDAVIERCDQLWAETLAADWINGQHEMHIGHALATALDYLQQQRTLANGVTGIRTWYYDLDRLLGGLHRGDLTILAARPSMGKTALMLNILVNAAAKDQRRIVLYSLEMSGAQIAQRLLASTSGIDLHRLRIAQVSDHEFAMLQASAQTMGQTQIFIDDTPALSPSALRARLKRLTAIAGPLDIVAIDYLQLMQAELRKAQSENRVQEISYISRSLKHLAREFDVAFLVLSQLSRSVEYRSDKRPMLSDLRDSGSIEQDADVVMMLYRDEHYNEMTEYKNIAELIIAKNRNGPTGKVMLFFDKALAVFRSLAHEPAAANSSLS